MRRLLVILYCFSNVYAIENVGLAKILDYEFAKEVKGPYNYKFSTSNGFKREETAELLHEGTEFESIFLRGSYQYEGDDGKLYTIKYRADDNGFHPEGDHIEVPPFVPWPSKIDIKYADNPDIISNLKQNIPENEKELKSTTTPRPNVLMRQSTTQKAPKPSLLIVTPNSIPSRFLSTPKPYRGTSIVLETSVVKQKLPEYSGPFFGAPTIPKKFLSTPKPQKSAVTVLNTFKNKPKGFYVTQYPRQSRPLVQDVTKEYLPTSSMAPPNKGDSVGSSTAKTLNFKFPKFSPINSFEFTYVPHITKEYIPTSPLPPKIKGDDAIGSSTAINNKIESFTLKPSQSFTSPQLSRKDPTFIPGVTNQYMPSSTRMPKKVGDYDVDVRKGSSTAINNKTEAYTLKPNRSFSSSQFYRTDPTSTPRANDRHIPSSTEMPNRMKNYDADKRRGSFAATNNKIVTFTVKPSQIFYSPQFSRRDPTFIPGVTNRYIPPSTEIPRKLKENSDENTGSGPTITYEGAPSNEMIDKNEHSNLLVLTLHTSRNSNRMKNGTRNPKILETRSGHNFYDFNLGPSSSQDSRFERNLVRTKSVSRDATGKSRQ